MSLKKKEILVTIFSGSSNEKLACGLAQALGAPLGVVDRSIFSNDEIRVWIKEKRVGKTAVLVQSLSIPTEKHLVEFALIADALQRMGVGELIGVIPWLGYSKQDKVFRPGEPLSVKVIAKMLQVIPLRRLYTFDLHNLAILGFFEIPVINLSARPLFVEYFASRVGPRTIVVAPDAGAVKNSTSFAQELGVPVVYLDKKRDLSTGAVTVVGSTSSVAGADVLLVDDLIVTGSTLVETAKYLKKHGAKSITVGATHHLYVKGAQRAIEESGIDLVVVTDTVAPALRSKKLKVLPVAGVVAEAIREG